MSRSGTVSQSSVEREAPGAGSPDAPHWPAADGRRIVFLLDANSGIERRHLSRWIEKTRPDGITKGDYRVLHVLSSRRRGSLRDVDPRLEEALCTGEDPLLTPLRVAWMAQADGKPEHTVSGSGLLSLSNPHDPGRWRQGWILRREPERCRIVVGDPAPASDLRRRWRRVGGSDASATTGLAEFVVRQAGLALERAERRLRGARYKVPRFVNEEILSRPAFRGGLAKLAWEHGNSEAEVSHEAERYLSEIAATHSTHLIDLTARLIRSIYTLGYGEALHYDRKELERIYRLAQRHPVVFLPSHKSNLDHLVLQYALHENGHPPNHTAGGINMNFFPVGPLVRRSGVFFIRRSFKKNEVYKYVLQNYIDYLIEKRFPLEWYLEGGRSRSGKLLPPRFGMLAYVVDAYRRGKSEDVGVIPVSINYDQIEDVGDYVLEQQGGKKQAESFSWFVRFLRRLRSHYGDIHIRFGEPISMHDFFGEQDVDAEPNPDATSLSVQKLGFEVMHRINRVTPMTPTSLLTLSLLGKGDRALTLDEIFVPLQDLVAYIRARHLPTTGVEDLESREGIRKTLGCLVDNGVVSCFADGPEPVWAIVPDQHLTAAYYRNTIIHFFVNGSIVEVALAQAVNAADPTATFWDEVMRLRDLLKFEFFFADKDEFLQEIRRELTVHDSAWESKLEQGHAETQGLLREIKPLNAHRVLRPFLSAYRVVGDALERQDASAKFDEAKFLSYCLALGNQYRLQRRIRSAESVSKTLFQSALGLAKNRGLLEADDAELAEKRCGFAEELRSALGRIDAIDALSTSRRARLID